MSDSELSDPPLDSDDDYELRIDPDKYEALNGGSIKSSPQMPPKPAEFPMRVDRFIVFRNEAEKKAYLNMKIKLEEASVSSQKEFIRHPMLPQVLCSAVILKDKEITEKDIVNQIVEKWKSVDSGAFFMFEVFQSIRHHLDGTTSSKRGSLAAGIFCATLLLSDQYLFDSFKDYMKDKATTLATFHQVFTTKLVYLPI